MDLHLTQVARVCPCREDLWLHLNTRNKSEIHGRKTFVLILG